MNRLSRRFILVVAMAVLALTAQAPSFGHAQKAHAAAQMPMCGTLQIGGYGLYNSGGSEGGYVKIWNDTCRHSVWVGIDNYVNNGVVTDQGCGQSSSTVATGTQYCSTANHFDAPEVSCPTGDAGGGTGVIHDWYDDYAWNRSDLTIGTCQ